MNDLRELLPNDIINKINLIPIHIIDISYIVTWKFNPIDEYLVKVSTRVRLMIIISPTWKL